MTCVFEAATGLEAHMVLNLLQQQGVEGRVEGEYLQGGVGELPAGSVVRVVVADEDGARARSIIAEWESRQPAPGPAAMRVRRPARAWAVFMFGLAVGVAGSYWAYRSPVTKDGIDHDGDGRLDERWTYEGGRMSRMEVDRNRDGKIDLVYSFDRNGVVSSAESDDDFDGRFETRVRYRNGQAQYQESDLNRDGVVDYRVEYRHGVLDVVEILDPASHRLRKRQKYVLGKLVYAEFDSSGDGSFDVRYDYDQFEEVAATIRIGQERR